MSASLAERRHKQHHGWFSPTGRYYPKAGTVGDQPSRLAPVDPAKNTRPTESWCPACAWLPAGFISSGRRDGPPQPRRWSIVVAVATTMEHRCGCGHDDGASLWLSPG